LPYEPARLIDPERANIVAALTRIRHRLRQSGELLAAVQLDHALDCLDPEHPLNQPSADRVS